MKKKIRVNDLSIDVVRQIMLFVARSPDGSHSFARALSVCKSFRNLENDNELLISVSFGNRSVSNYPESFWGINGLLTRCAFANNSQAREILAKYLEGRVEDWNKRVVLVEKAAKVAREMFESRRAVTTRATNTRARERAADLAMEEYKEMLVVAEKEGRELQNHLRALAPIET